MDRLEQIRKDFITKFFAKEGRMPTEKEVEEWRKSASIYNPITTPMVPLKFATSNADYVRKDLLDLLKDRNLIDDLLLKLSDKIERVESATIAETNNTIKFAESILTDTKENNHSIIYNETPILYDAADVSDWYLKIYGDELYAEDPGTSSEPVYLSQYITLDSFNVKGGREGISLVENSVTQLASELKIDPYSRIGNPILQTLSSANPISMMVTGEEGVEKGIDISMAFSGKRISSIVIDTKAINCTVLVDGIELFTKSLDGVSTLSIGSIVNEKLIIRLHDTMSQVHVLVDNLSVFESIEDSAGGFTTGRYVTLELDVPKDIVPFKFKPDEYIPSGGSINWEWSNSRILWHPIEQDELGQYLPINWNLLKPETEPSGNQDPYKFYGDWHTSSALVNGTNLTRIAHIDGAFTVDDDGVEKDISGVTVKAGRGCILFVTKAMKEYNAFLLYIDVTDDTGYRLDLTNPSLPNGGNLISNISIKSDTFSVNSAASSSIIYEIPKGIHKLELRVNESLDFESYDFSEKNIMQVLLDDFSVNFNIDLSADTLGREIDYGVQLYGLTETDIHKLSFMGETDQIQKFGMTSTPYSQGLRHNIITREMHPTDLYDIVPLDYNRYASTSTEHAGYELHFYAGNGASDWVVTLHNTPIGDVEWNETGDTFTPVNDTITIPNASLSSTLVSKRELVTLSGEDNQQVFEIEHAPVGQALSLVKDNISYQPHDLGLDSGLEEDFGTFTPKGNDVFNVTLSSNADQQTFTLSMIPQVGYCTLENWTGLIDFDLRSEMITDCEQKGGSWVTGYCSGDTSTTEAECLCGSGGAWDGSTCTEGVSSGFTWTEYVKAGDAAWVNFYTIDDVDWNTKEVTVSGLTGLSGLEFELRYAFGDMQSTDLLFKHEQTYTIENAGTEIISLERIPKATEQVFIYLPNSNHASGALTPTYSASTGWILDLTGVTDWGAGSFTNGQIITLVYKCETSITTDGTQALLSNLPRASKTRKVYTEVGNSIEPTSSTNIILTRVPASRASGGSYSDPDGNISIKINGQSGTCAGYETTSGTTDEVQPSTKSVCETAPSGGAAGTWTSYDLVNSLEGNVLNLDLSDWTAAEGELQEPVYITTKYESYDHSEQYKLLVEYTYYESVPYTFNYQYNQTRLLNIYEIYQSGNKRREFYDISYYKIAGDNLYLKAELNGSGKESPIIRRIRFER